MMLILNLNHNIIASNVNTFLPQANPLAIHLPGSNFDNLLIIALITAILSLRLAPGRLPPHIVILIRASTIGAADIYFLAVP